MALNYPRSSCALVLVAGSCFQREGGEPRAGHGHWAPCLRESHASDASPGTLRAPFACSVLCITPHTHSRGTVCPFCHSPLGTALLALLDWRGRPARASSFEKPLPMSGPPRCLSTQSRSRRPWRLSLARTGLQAGRRDC